MKKLSKVIWVLVLSIPPVLSMDSVDADKDSSTERKVLCRSVAWQNGKKLWEKVECVPDAPKEQI